MKIIATDRSTQPESAGKLYRALVGVGVICALLIVSVFLLTLPAIQKNQAEALQRAIFKALPEARSKHTFALDSDARWITPVPDGYRGRVVHAGYDAGEQLVGLAIEAEGMGYQDSIRLLYGYAPERQVIVGMQVLESKETPGLGDKIEKDPRFLNNFEQLDVSLDAQGTAIRNPIVAVKTGHKREPWQIDGITGATVSSKAVAEILAASSGQWMPLLHRQRDQFRLEGVAETTR